MSCYNYFGWSFVVLGALPVSLNLGNLIVIVIVDLKVLGRCCFVGFVVIYYFVVDWNEVDVLEHIVVHFGELLAGKCTGH
jgi:hypothetical protein